MTIQEFREAKYQLEREIADLLNDFEKLTGVRVEKLGVQKLMEGVTASVDMYEVRAKTAL
jgi:hypothetical protein